MRAVAIEREQVEQSAREACDRGHHQEAATIAVRAYGPEVYGLLVSLLRNPDDAADVFANASTAMWRSLRTFSWNCSLRTWMYTIARHEAGHVRRDAARRERRAARVGDSALDQVAAHVRTETQSFLQTAKRTRLQELREQLPQDDQLLLVLRVDRDMQWNEIAHVMSNGAETSAREVARLRKRFQLVKARLVAEAKRRGLVV